MSAEIKRRISDEAIVASSVSSESKDTTLEKTLPPVQETETSTGAFSQQKGGAAALAITAMLDAMEAQLEAVKLKRHRAEISIENQSRATELQAENLTNIGAIEWLGGLLTGILGAVAGGLAVYGAGKMTYENFKTDKQVNPLIAERKNAENHISALQQLIAKPPESIILTTNAGGQSPALGRLQNGVLESTTGRKYEGSIQGDDALTKLLQELPDDTVDALKHASRNNEQYPGILKTLQDKVNELDKKVEHTSRDFANNNTKINAWIQGTNGLLVSAASSMIKGLYVDPSVKEEEAKKAFNDLTASFTREDVELQTRTAGERESDFRGALNLLRDMTSADLRA